MPQPIPLDAGAGLATVQKLMGHASVNTTSGYDRRATNTPSAARSGSCMCRILDALGLTRDAVSHLGPICHQGFLGQKPLRRARRWRKKSNSFFRLLSYRAERADFHLYLNQDVGEWDANRLGQAIVLTGLQLDPDDSRAAPDLVRLNRGLAQHKVRALVCLGHDPAVLKQRVWLLLFFALYKMQSRDHFTGSIAVGRCSMRPTAWSICNARAAIVCPRRKSSPTAWSKRYAPRPVTG